MRATEDQLLRRGSKNTNQELISQRSSDGRQLLHI